MFCRYLIKRNIFHNIKHYNLKSDNRIFFAGQITGVEGYVESISSGFVAAINAISKIKGTEKIVFDDENRDFDMFLRELESIIL